MRHDVAMTICYNKSDMRSLPPAGLKVDFGEFADLGVSESARQRLQRAGLIEQDDAGMWYVTRELEQYLSEKHGIDLSGGGQATLGGTSDVHHDPDVRSAALVEPNPGSPPTTRQESLTGDDATTVVQVERWREMEAAVEDAADAFEPKYVAAEQDARQVRLDAFAAHHSRLQRPTGEVYPHQTV